MRKFLALFRRNRKRRRSWRADETAHMPAWSAEGRMAVAAHIARVSNMEISPKGWAALRGRAG